MTLLLLFGASEGGGGGGSSAGSDNVPYSGSAYYARNMSVLEAEAWVEKNLALLEVNSPKFVTDEADKPAKRTFEPKPPEAPKPALYYDAMSPSFMPIMNMPQAKAAPPKPKFEWWKQ
jgi:hypothetical protein